MSQSGYIAAALIAGFVLYLAAKNRLITYASVLWGPEPAPPSGSTGSSNSSSGSGGSQSSSTSTDEQDAELAAEIAVIAV